MKTDHLFYVCKKLRLSKTANISFCEALNRERDIQFHSHAAHSLPQFR